MKQRWITAAAIAASLLMSACSGGQGGPQAALPAVPASNAGGLTATATFTVSIPHDSLSQSSMRSAKYLTSLVKGIDFQVQQDLSAPGAVQAAPGDRGYVFYALTPQATYCVNGSTALVCTLPVKAYPGADLITVSTYDSTNPSTPGQNGGSSHVISTGYVTANILPGVDNPISIVTHGVVTYMTAGLDTPFPPAGTPLTQPLRLLAMDASYNIIIGDFDMPLQASSPDATGKITVSSASITSSATLPNVVYNGGTGVSAYIKVITTSPYTTANRRFTFIQTFTLLNPNGVGVSPSPATLSFAHANSAAQTVTLTVKNTTGSPGVVDVTRTDNNQNPACNGIVSAVLSGSTVTVTPIKAGVCGLWVAGGILTAGNYNATGTVPIVVSP